MAKIPTTRKEDIIKSVKKYEGKKVKLAVTDIDGILRGKVIHLEKFLSVSENGFGFCDVVFGWDCSDTAYDNTDYTGWHTGYPDAWAQIDINTYRTIPWDNHIPFFLADFVDKDYKPLQMCPRQLLKKIKTQAEKAGYQAYFSQEFEWFNFQETPQSWANKHHIKPTPLTPGMFGYSILRSSQQSTFFNDLFDNMRLFNVPLEGIHTETGPGVYEAAILYADILEAADRAVLFKTGVKEIAARHNIMASFMAKWNEHLPGCSGHIHQSLWDERKNLFFNAADPLGMSELMKSYVAGQLFCLPHILPMYAPTINSYKRLVEGAWAPTTLTWAPDNRTTALRILTNSQKSARLETRVVGADANPYLAMAACLASGLYGIKKKLKLQQPPTTGSGYQDIQHGTLPRTLWEATEKMKTSEIAHELFGEAFVKHFTQTREWECKQFNKAITDWELRRYFEII